MGRCTPTLSVLAVLCGAVAVSATAAPAAAISPAFVARATKVCAAIDADLNHALGPFPFPHFDPAKPDRKTLVLVGKHFAKALPVRRTIPGRPRALGEPRTGRAAWDAIRSLADENNAVSIQQVSAALAADTKTFVGTYHRLVRLQRQITTAAAAAGFQKSSACSDAF